MWTRVLSLVTAISLSVACTSKDESDSSDTTPAPAPAPAPAPSDDSEPAPTPAPNPTPSPAPTPAPTPDSDDSEPAPAPTPNPEPEPTPAPAPEPAPSGKCNGDEYACAAEAEISAKNNALRSQNGVKALAYSERLADVSRDWSKQQAARGSIGHDGFPDNRIAVLKRLHPNASEGIHGENVAMNGRNFPTGKEAGDALYTQWEGSAGHKKNMLDTKFIVVGNGVAKASDGAVYGTQIFGSSNGLQGALTACTSVTKQGDKTASSARCVVITK